jgi:glycosyltransferase involved in cell wall biosynthesis
MLSYHRWHKTWNRFVDRFVVPSRLPRDKYVEAGFPKEKFSIKPNFLRPDPGVGAGAGDYAIFAGRLSAEKGVLTLLDAWPRLSGDHELLIVGDGPLAKEVQRAVDRDARIKWLGRQSLDEVCRLMGDACFSIMPSIWHEPFGRTVIESFAVGTPVLASRMGAMLELVTENHTGRFFEPNNAADLAHKVMEMFSATALKDPTAKETMRAKVRQEYLEKFTAEKNYGELISIYDEAIRTRAQAS